MRRENNVELLEAVPSSDGREAYRLLCKDCGRKFIRRKTGDSIRTWAKCQYCARSSLPEETDPIWSTRCATLMTECTLPASTAQITSFGVRQGWGVQGAINVLAYADGRTLWFDAGQWRAQRSRGKAA